MDGHKALQFVLVTVVNKRLQQTNTNIRSRRLKAMPGQEIVNRYFSLTIEFPEAATNGHTKISFSLALDTQI